MTETAIAPLQMDCPLASTVHLKNMSESDLMVIGKAFLGDGLTDAQRLNKAETVRSQFMLFIDNIDNSKGGRDKILRCVTQSVAECMLTLASLDLPLVKTLKYAALIPYGNVCTVTIQYQGLCQLIYRTGSVASVQCGVVYKGDQFAYELGTNPALRQIRGAEPATEANVTHAWALAHNISGPDTIEVMELEDLKKVKKASKMSTGPAWRTWWSQMYRKAPIRRMVNYLRTEATGIAQAALARVLELENSEFMLDQQGKYKELREAHSDDLSARAAATLKTPAALPEPAGTPPPEANEDAELLAFVQNLRDGVESSMSDGEFIQQVIFDKFGKQKIENRVEFCAVWNEIVNLKNRDLDTAEKLPEGL